MAILAFLGVIVADQGIVGGSAALSPSLLGLSLIYGLQLTGLLQMTIRLVVEVRIQSHALLTRVSDVC